jgi:hypothetical protein
VPFRFTPQERWAVFTVHGEVCYICRHPLNFRECEIDHILSQSLRNDRKELTRINGLLGRPADFNVDSPVNWSPACRRCNGLKRDRPWDPSLLVQLHLQFAADHAPKVSELIEKQINWRELEKAVATVQRAVEQGLITKDMIPDVAVVLEVQRPYRAPEKQNQPVRLAPELEVLSDRNGLQVVRGPYGVGGRSTVPGRDPSWDCPNCGAAAAWSGARCIMCGMLSDE